ncbi:hypothetical protein Q8A67_004025 [Cirrhinus molitorella]|uniref:Uncharacterized protein n=1 Tax=Cirrhinus molitorella TaxID=172907 RepID=A0AA88QFK7_9TELE|nr:hypothetical protein Q8A67_004025 [Cirrhinus molitorella]
MELQQHFPVSMNEYNESETTQRRSAFQTEDVYQCLQYKPPAAQGTINSTTLVSKHSERKYVFLLFTMNILISAIILILVGLNYKYHAQQQFKLTHHLKNSHNKETQPTKEEAEVWLLHDNVFYLFWSDCSDCNAAERFCSKRNASLAILTEHNKVWLMSRTNGKQFLVSRASSDGSGDNYSFSVDDEDHECGIMTNYAGTDHGEGFVCERRTTFTDHKKQTIIQANLGMESGDSVSRWLKSDIFIVFVVLLLLLLLVIFAVCWLIRRHQTQRPTEY